MSEVRMVDLSRIDRMDGILIEYAEMFGDSGGAGGDDGGAHGDGGQATVALLRQPDPSHSHTLPGRCSWPCRCAPQP